MSTWLVAAVGGVLIGLSALLLMGSLGRIAGISGIASGLLGRGERAWRLAFVLGLVAGAPLMGALRGDTGIGAPQVALGWMALAGVLVGVGTGLGSGCTSGHGVCGIARLSPRSLAATATFMISGMAAVFVIRHLLGGL